MKGTKLIAALLFLIFLNIYLYSAIFSLLSDKGKVCFLDVGQGDAELVRLPKGVDFLIDAGRDDKKIVWQLGKNLSPLKRRIEVAILSHPDFDHWGGFQEVSKRYRLGAFLWNGSFPSTPHLSERFLKTLNNLKEENTLLKKLAYPDEIIYQNYRFRVIWPRKESYFKKTNNNSLVIYLLSPRGERIIFPGDIEKPAEKKLFSIYGDSLQADILKFPHHGSKGSLEANFLEAIKPEKIVIEVGRNNPYHHPSKETLFFLRKMGSQIWRTDLNGTVCFDL